MKAVIASICPDANLVDITHEVEPYNIRMGAYLLYRAAPWFPDGTIHLAVVDPGVGGPRKPLIVEAEKGLLVGPDNGLLIPAARRLKLKKVYNILDEKSLFPKRFTETFHGRDIFAPTAAFLAKGVKPDELGVEASSHVQAAFPEAEIIGNEILGEIIHVDRFGNLVTNMETEMVKALNIEFGEKLKIVFADKNKTFEVRLLKAYAEASENEILLIPGSGGTLEISINQADASKILDVKNGVKIRVKPYQF
jgi:hypothetical protein